MEDRITVNVGPASVVARPNMTTPEHLTLFVETADGKRIDRGFIASRSDGLDVLQAAQAELFSAPHEAQDWLSRAAHAL